MNPREGEISYRILQMPERRLRRPGGFNFLEQELTRCSVGGFSLVRGCSAIDPAPGWFESKRLRFLLARNGHPLHANDPARGEVGDDGCEYTVVVMTLIGPPAGDATLYAHNTADEINDLSRYGYRVVECQAWSRFWLIILERPFGLKASSVRYEVVPIARTEAAAVADDRTIVGMVATRTHLFPIRVVPGRVRRATARIPEREPQTSRVPAGTSAS
ncbi:MAG: hypothetical protein AB7S36_09055 [Planctomycetota bacterium]